MGTNHCMWQVQRRMALHGEFGNEGEEGQSLHEDGDGEIWTITLKGLYAGEHGISEREGDYLKDMVFCLAFHISHVRRPTCSLQGAYANFYHPYHLPSAGFSASEPVLFALHFPESHFTRKVPSPYS